MSTASSSAATTDVSSTRPSRRSSCFRQRARSSAIRAEPFVSGGPRRGTDLLKAVALGARTVLAGRAPLYGLCAAGMRDAARALEIVENESLDAMGLLGARSVDELGMHFLAHSPTDAERGRGVARGIASLV